MLRKNNRLNRQNVSKHQFLNDFRGTRKLFFSQSKAPSARWWSAALIEVQPFRGYESCQGRLCRCWTWLTWLFFQHIWTLSDREFVAVLGRWSRRSFLLHEHTFVDVPKTGVGKPASHGECRSKHPSGSRQQITPWMANRRSLRREGLAVTLQLHKRQLTVDL